MKIEKLFSTQITTVYQKNQDRQMPKQTNTVKTDQLEISAEAKALLGSQSLQEASRSNKLQHLKQQIESGQYKVDSYKVAEKLYQFWFQK